jgi:hypothetical protein
LVKFKLCIVILIIFLMYGWWYFFISLFILMIMIIILFWWFHMIYIILWSRAGDFMIWIVHKYYFIECFYAIVCHSYVLSYVVLFFYLYIWVFLIVIFLEQPIWWIFIWMLFKIIFWQFRCFLTWQYRMFQFSDHQCCFSFLALWSPLICEPFLGRNHRRIDDGKLLDNIYFILYAHPH